MRTLLLISLACAGTWAVYAHGQSDSDVQAKILAMEHVWGQAYANKDPRALERILDDSFINIDSDGNLQTKAGVLAEVKKSTSIHFATESLVVRLHGDTAIVTGTFVVKEVDGGKRYAQRERFVDTWVCKDGHWVSIAGLVTRIEP